MYDHVMHFLLSILSYISGRDKWAMNYSNTEVNAELVRIRVTRILMVMLREKNFIISSCQ